MGEHVVRGLHHVQLAMPPGREEKTRAFFAGLLGLEEIPKPANLAARGGVWFRLGLQELHCGVEEPFTPARKAHPAFLVRDLSELRSRLELGGWKTRDDEPLSGYQRCYLDDPFGNRIELMQPLT